MNVVFCLYMTVLGLVMTAVSDNYAAGWALGTGIWFVCLMLEINEVMRAA